MWWVEDYSEFLICMLDRWPEGHGSVWEQRNAAVVGTVLGGGRARGEGGRSYIVVTRALVGRLDRSGGGAERAAISGKTRRAWDNGAHLSFDTLTAKTGHFASSNCCSRPGEVNLAGRMQSFAVINGACRLLLLGLHEVCRKRAVPSLNS